MEYNNPLNTSAVNHELFNRLFPQAMAANRNQAATAPQPAAPAGVTYERYEVDYLNVKLSEQGIAGENRKATGSQLSSEAVHLTYERLQVNAGAAAGAVPEFLQEFSAALPVPGMAAAGEFADGRRSAAGDVNISYIV